MSTVVEKNEGRSKNVSVPVHPATRDQIASLLENVNAKKHGRTIRADELIAEAVKLVGKETIEALQQRSLTNSDRIALSYEKYVEENGPLSKDTYLGLLIAGKTSLVSREGREVENG